MVCLTLNLACLIGHKSVMGLFPCGKHFLLGNTLNLWSWFVRKGQWHEHGAKFCPVLPLLSVNSGTLAGTLGPSRGCLRRNAQWSWAQISSSNSNNNNYDKHTYTCTSNVPHAGLCTFYSWNMSTWQLCIFHKSFPRLSLSAMHGDQAWDGPPFYWLWAANGFHGVGIVFFSVVWPLVGFPCSSK